ncbi:hypothetical protein Scep_029272 [Stephania cephalantha]|uniref:Uncharacterized protein n=1 Tax=Stephania cephalantha TaxID=152367 RepID=A0AAP0HFM9_9MAGN
MAKTYQKAIHDMTSTQDQSLADLAQSQERNMTLILDTSAGSTSTTYNVVSLGAKADGRTDSSRAFLSAWSSACASNAAATVFVPKGSYLLRNVVFSGQCKNLVTFQIEGATLVAPSDYGTDSWITFERVSGVKILGGTLDGQGAGLWACKNAGKGCPSGATSLEITNSREILISGLTSTNSQMFHIVIHDCENVKVQGVQVTAPGNSPNTDGIHVEGSSGVTISRATIKTGDDCISIGPAPPTYGLKTSVADLAMALGNNINLEHQILGTYIIGSLGKDKNEQGVQNVTVKTVVFSGTENGVRIKTWARSSQGFVRGVLFEDATMNNARNPIIIDQQYCPHDGDCPNQSSGVKISDVTYRNIKGSSASEIAMNFDCSHTNPCSNIVLDNVDLTYENKVATASCKSADGSATGLVHPASCLA